MDRPATTRRLAAPGEPSFFLRLRAPIGWLAMTEGTYVVSCMGVIDDGARARISLEFPADGWTGGGLAPGQPFPSVSQRFQFRVAAASEQDAIDTVRELVEAAGGHADEFEAEPA
jgi:hypothetical protein